MPRDRRPAAEPATIVLEATDTLERRARATDGGVVVEVWERRSVVILSADDVALLYGIAQARHGDR